MKTSSTIKRGIVLAVSLLVGSAALLLPTAAQASTTTFGKPVTFTFEPATDFNSTVVKVRPVDGANSYWVFVDNGGAVKAERKCGLGWTNCHWFATIEMPRDRASKVTVMAALEAGNRITRVGVTSETLFNPTDVKVALNIAASLKWHEARRYTPPAVTSPQVRQFMRGYYRCKSWTPRAVSVLLVAQAALHDPEDLKGAYDIVTASDLSPQSIRAFLGTSTTSGACERSHIAGALGGAYLTKNSFDVTVRLREALTR